MDEDIFILIVSILFAMDMVRKGYWLWRRL